MTEHGVAKVMILSLSENCKLFKVADFGLARDLEGGNYYRKVQGVEVEYLAQSFANIHINDQRWGKLDCQCCG